jgi:cellulose synthase (UDP-forming)
VSSFTLALFWNLLNTVILGLFVATAVRESRNNRREAHGKPPVGAKRAAKKAATHPEPAIAGNGLAERTYDELTPVGAR